MAPTTEITKPELPYRKIDLTKRISFKAEER